jgi:hypothetical protein
MSALRKEKPFAATDAASQKRAAVVPPSSDKTDDRDEVVDPASRRPPQSVTTSVTDDTSDRAIDDTYDGEIVSSTVDETPGETPPPGATPRASSTPGPTPGPQAAVRPAASSQASRQDTHLFDEEALRDFRARWDQVQTSFVDEPRHAVELADALVGTVVKRIADQFAGERAKLEKQWGRGQNVSTEDLRQNFKRYRAFFDRLLGF